MKRDDPVVKYGSWLVAGTALITSFGILFHLATAIGWGRFSVLLPLYMETLMIIGWRVWQRRSFPERARACAKRISLSYMGVSMVAQILGHMLEKGWLDADGMAGGVLVIVFAVVPVVSTVVVFHLHSLVTEDEPEQIEQSTEEPVVEEAQPDPAPTPKRKPRKASSGRRSPKRDKAWMYWQAERAKGRTPSGAELARSAGADPTMGVKWRNDWIVLDAQPEAEPSLHLVPT